MDASGHVGAECYGRATGCGTSNKNACKEVDKLYALLAKNLQSEAQGTEC